MSKYKGNIISSTAAVSSGTNYTGRADGKWSVQDQIQAKKSSLWAKGQSAPSTPTVTASANTDGVSATITISVSDNGGSTVTSYNVTASDGQTTSTSSSTFSFGALTSGTSYTFTATATNSVGTSGVSAPSNSVMPISAKTMLLAHFNNNWTDSSPLNQTITPQGTATFSSSIVKFGSGSSYYDGSSNSRALITLPAILGDFTIEFFVYYTSSQPSYYPTILGIGPGTLAADLCFICEYPGTGLNATFPNGASISVGSALAINTWKHIALCRSGSNTRFFVDGVQIGSTLTSSYTIPTQNLYVGDRPAAAAGGNYPAKCYIDDIRIVKQALYTANFTPPSSELQVIT
jgi:hypothetical protein